MAASLTTAQVRALFALDTRKEATPGQIAELAQLSPGGVTGMLDDLERDGIVTRVRSDATAAASSSPSPTRAATAAGEEAPPLVKALGAARWTRSRGATWRPPPS